MDDYEQLYPMDKAAFRADKEKSMKRTIMDNTLEQSIEMTADSIPNTSLQRFIRALVRALSPML